MWEAAGKMWSLFPINPKWPYCMNVWTCPTNRRRPIVFNCAKKKMIWTLKTVAFWGKNHFIESSCVSHCLLISYSLWYLVPLQTCNQEGSLSLHLCRSSVPVLRMHHHQEQCSSGVEPRLQLSPHNTEQSVSQAGALQWRKNILFDACFCRCCGGLHLCPTQYLLLGTHQTCCHSGTLQFMLCLF